MLVNIYVIWLCFNVLLLLNRNICLFVGMCWYWLMLCYYSKCMKHLANECNCCYLCRLLCGLYQYVPLYVFLYLIRMDGQRWFLLVRMGIQKQQECCSWNAMLISIFKTMLVNIFVVKVYLVFLGLLLFDDWMMLCYYSMFMKHLANEYNCCCFLNYVYFCLSCYILLERMDSVDVCLQE